MRRGGRRCRFGLAIGAVAIAKPVGTVRRNERSTAVGNSYTLHRVGQQSHEHMFARLHPSYVIAHEFCVTETCRGEILVVECSSWYGICWSCISLVVVRKDKSK